MIDKSRAFAKYRELLRKEKLAFEALLKGTPREGCTWPASAMAGTNSLVEAHELAKAATEAHEQEINKAA